MAKRGAVTGLGLVGTNELVTWSQEQVVTGREMRRGGLERGHRKR